MQTFVDSLLSDAAALAALRQSLSAWLTEYSDAAESAVDSDVAFRPDVTVDLADAEDWQSDWRDSEGGSYPSYTLSIKVNGLEVAEVNGWHSVGYFGPDGDRQHREWDAEDDDSQVSGLPCANIVGGKVIIEGGYGCSDLVLPSHIDGTICVYDLDDINAAIKSAADDADHGDEPETQDLADQPKRAWDRECDRYAIRDGKVVEVTIESCYLYHDGEDHDGCQKYLLSGFRTSDDAGTIYETEEEAIASIEGDKVYEDESEAEAAIQSTLDAGEDD